MINSTLDRGLLDRTTPSWMLVWSGVFSVAIGGILHGVESADLSDDIAVFLAIAMGAVSAAWLMVGTWTVLIDMPQFEPTLSASVVTSQRVWPRIGMLLLWLANVGTLAFFVRHDSNAMGKVLIVASVGIMGPIILWQWTQQRIHRGVVLIKQKRSIRQILGLTFTVAVMIAILNLSRVLFDSSSAFATLVVSNALLWALMLWIMLGRWWWMIIVTVPIILAQGIAVSSLIAAGRDADSQAVQLGGFSCSFYLLSLLLLTVLRSGGHRWMMRNQRKADSNRPASPLSEATANA